MRTIIIECDFKNYTLTPILSLKIKLVTVKNVHKPQMFPHRLINSNILCACQRIIKTYSLNLIVYLLFLAASFCFFVILVLLVEKKTNFQVRDLGVLYSLFTKQTITYRYFKVMLLSPIPKSKWVMNRIFCDFSQPKVIFLLMTLSWEEITQSRMIMVMIVYGFISFELKDYNGQIHCHKLLYQFRQLLKTDCYKQKCETLKGQFFAQQAKIIKNRYKDNINMNPSKLVEGIKMDWMLASDSKTNRSQINLNNILTDVYNVATSQFEKKFIYGINMKIMHKGRPKQMYVYLDSKRETLLWISSKTKAFLVDLYLSAMFIKRNTTNTQANESQKYYIVLRQLQEQVTFVFDKQEQKNYYFNLFNSYISNLKKKYPNYSIYFSNINKQHALNSTKNGTNLITQDEILQISMNIGLNNKKQNSQILLSCMKQHKVSDNRNIPIKCFDDYFSIRFCHSEVQPIFEKFSQQSVGDVKKNPRAILRGIMSPTQFRNFLKKCQKQNEQQIQKVLNKYQGDISFYDFSRYLYDSQFNSASRIQQTPENFPLKDYFCYSSHNTYLTGNQLTSDSQVERYSEDLQIGIKCVQLDIHDDSSKPLVNHAFKNLSLCKPIDFEDVIKVIKIYSAQCDLENSVHYPIILSLENHASFENRQYMLEIITRHFGNKLFKLQNQQHFPQLGYLKGKILIKTNSSEQELRLFKQKAVGKKLSNSNSIEYFGFQGDQENNKSSKLSAKYKEFIERKNKLEKQKYYFNSWFESQEQLLFAIVKEMTKITTIFKSREGIKGNELSQFGCTSLTYSSTIQAMKKNPQGLINYTKTSWLRTYPHGSQISSYNYDPAQMLAVGAQIIALNTQTKDEYAWMMYGYFCGGYSPNPARRGYVLKPAKLRSIPKQMQQQSKLNKIKIKIIYSEGQNVRMKFYGMPSDNASNANSTTQFSFANPDESFIMFYIGSKYRNCIAVRWILEGYRIIQGRSVQSYIDCGKRVLIHIQKYFL